MKLTCHTCGDDFEHKTPTKRFCSRTCRNRLNNHRQRCPNGDGCNGEHRRNPRKSTPDLGRIEQFIDRSGGPDACWEWRAFRNPLGYGMTNWHVGGVRKTVIAHRAYYSLTKGVRLTSDVHLLHSCDNTPCCNPAHLRPGTHIENMADRKNRGAGYPKGAAVYNAIQVDDEVVAAVRAEYLPRTPGRSALALAQKYGLTRSTVQKIVTRTGRWAESA